MEYAVFNTDAELVSSTQTYFQQKGRKVHIASLDEVMSEGSIIVNKPGLMDSCHGCRFVNNCPSTIEILSCIKLNGTVIGVISLTSFSQRGHDIISENTNNYINTLEYISNLITMFAYNENSQKDSYILQEAFNFMTKKHEHNYLIINESGILLHWDKEIEKLFFYCNLYSQTIHQMFPEDIVNWIFSNQTPSKKTLNIRGIHKTLHIYPLKTSNTICGYLLKLSKDEIKQNKKDTKEHLNSIVSINSEINKIKQSIIHISESPSSVLITGQTGTGKEMIAKAIHYESNRANEPFVPINCANIPESLFESELFGYEEGSFTGAKKGGKLGLFEMANNGTIFLDEIGELTLFQQAKLLRVLQDSSIQRVGGNLIIPLNIRFIAATNRELEEMIKEDQFRSDLYYRINVIPINLPNLIERTEDIPLLVKHFIQKYNEILNKDIVSIAGEAMNLLKSYSWPGNIRELENIIEYAINMTNSTYIQSYDLPPKIYELDVKGPAAKEILKNKELNFISRLLDNYGWDLKGKQKVAEELGISLRTLYRKLEKDHNI